MQVTIMQRHAVSGGKAEALPILAATARDAAAAGAHLLVTPEMFLSGYAIGAEAIAAAAEPGDGALWQAVAEIAREAGIAIVAGGPLLRDGRPYNAARAYGPDGALLAGYEKVQLFGEVDRSQFAPGPSLSPVFHYRGWGIGLAICYDIEFPEVARGLALAGAEFLAVPTANMLPFTSVCTRLVPARAEENGIAIAYANYVGPEGPFDYCGLSCVVGADGEDLARAGVQDTLLHARLDREALLTQRARTGYLADLRRDLFGPTP
ncbi:MAG: nitrilase-related carbon-nitrogen hydrolase [Pseudomonadota bacterium]